VPNSSRSSPLIPCTPLAGRVHSSCHGYLHSRCWTGTPEHRRCTDPTDAADQVNKPLNVIDTRGVATGPPTECRQSTVLFLPVDRPDQPPACPQRPAARRTGAVPVVHLNVAVKFTARRSARQH
jgi:hypothetical protein